MFYEKDGIFADHRKFPRITIAACGFTARLRPFPMTAITECSIVARQYFVVNVLACELSLRET